MTGTPTLEDVAHRAGVSTATVSRCLNAPEKVVRETRERVLRVVQELGYAPNFSARALAARKTQTIGAIIPTMENAIFAQGLQAFQERLGQKGFMLLVASSSYDSDIEAEQVRALVARGADGLLLIGHDRDPAIYRFLKTQNVPALVTWAYRPDVPSIGFDNRAAMRVLAQRAFELGHRKFGVISAPVAENDRARARVDGIFDAASGFGLSNSDIPVIETSYDTANGASAFDRFYDQGVTLVFCGNDVLAAGALRRANERGIQVPQEISITGFDDIELANLVTPRLTTVHVPHREMGAAAADALIALSEGTWTGKSVCLPTRIVDGLTLGVPRPT